jgi:hypothetical protein
LLATYTKRSVASSQEHPGRNHREMGKTIPQVAINQRKDEANLKGLERQISFLERAWLKARSQGQKAQSRKYKQDLMTLIGQFWQTTQ